MRYEIYYDTLFFELLFWNGCVLWLTNRSLWSPAGKKRLLGGGMLGALSFVGILFLPMNAALKLGAMMLGSCLMLGSAFPIKGLRSFLKVMERYWVCAVLLGSAVLLLTKLLSPLMENGQGAELQSLLLGRKKALEMVLEVLITFFGSMFLRKRACHACEGEAVLFQGGKKKRVKVLVDSGNSLYEPISGKPVCILDEETAKDLWTKEDLFRVIPYRAVGVEKGILRGYLLSGMRLEMGGPAKEINKVYVAIGPRTLLGEKDGCLIMHPDLLTGETERKTIRVEGGRNVS